MNTLFLGGVSTDAEVAKLMQNYKDAKPGDELSHEAISQLIEVPYGTHRYRTVVDRFRRLLFTQHNLELTAITRHGYRVSTGKERLDNSVARANRAFKQTHIAAYRAAVVPDSQLTRAEQERKTHLQVVLSKVVAATQAASRDIAPPSPVKSVANTLGDHYAK